MSRKPTAANREILAAYQAGLHGISYRSHIDSAGGDELDFDGKPTEHGRNVKQAWRDGNAERRRQRRADTAARARTGASRAAAAARRAAPSPSKRDVRQAAATFGGNGSALGLLVGAFALVLLYVLLANTKVMTNALSGVTRFLTNFMSPYQPLF